MLMLLFLIVIAALCCLFWMTLYLWKYAKVFASLRNLKGPRGYFLGGVLNSKEVTNLNTKCYAPMGFTVWDFGSIFKISGFPLPVVMISSPEYVQKLYGSKEPGHLKKPFFYDPVKPLFGDSVFTSTGETWKSHRQPMSYINSYRHLHSYMNIFNKESHRIVDDLKDLLKQKREEATSVLHIFTKSALFSVTESLFNKSLTEEDPKVVEELVQGLDRFKKLRDQRLLEPWLIPEQVFRLSFLSREVNLVTQKLRAYYKNLISQFKMDMEPSNLTAQTSQRPLVRQMLQFSEEGVLDEVIATTMAGFETTGMTLQLLLFFLALHPEHQEMCRKEVDEILNNPTKCETGCIAHEHLSYLKHLERCVMETLRFFPPVYLVSRKLEASLKLNDEYTLLPGTNVVVVPRELHMNSDIYPNPEIFDPNRFLPDECKRRHPYAYFPFAGGPRKCIGFKFATIQIIVACARILHNFVVTTPLKFQDVKIVAGMKITIDPNVPFNFRKRWGA